MDTPTKQSIANITYSGKVTLTTKQGNKILRTKTFHNQGLPKLFSGLSALLADGSSERTIIKRASSIIPHYIALYGFQTETYARQSPPTTAWDALIERDDSNLRKSGLELITSLIQIDKSENDGADLSLYFKIDTAGVAAGKKVYLLALFPRVLDQDSDLENSAIAVYKLTDGNGKWLAEDIITTSTLLIEWQMSFKNATND